jgi:hypothetical protein
VVFCQNKLKGSAMLKHIQEVEISIFSDIFGHARTDQQNTKQHKFIIDKQEIEHTRFDAQKPATILPKQAHFVCLTVDRQGNTFVFSEKLYTAKLHYSLRNIIPNESVVFALVFQIHKGKHPVLGIFDSSCVGGQSLAQYNCVQRHGILHQAFKGSAKYPHIRMHWVGHERVLVHDLQYKRVSTDFDIDCAIRLPDSISYDMTCVRLLPKEPLVTLVPKLNSAKMLETMKRKRAKLGDAM